MVVGDGGGQNERWGDEVVVSDVTWWEGKASGGGENKVLVADVALLGAKTSGRDENEVVGDVSPWEGRYNQRWGQ
jgi:hypothetical protein